MNWLYKLERKFGKYYISRLMLIITMGSACSYFLSMVFGTRFLEYFYLDPEKILQGQIWRLVSFVIVTPSTSVLYVFSILLYYVAGNALENIWGEFKFNVYYLVGVISTIIVAFISYVLLKNIADLNIINNYYSNLILAATIMNLSLFLAYAKIYPDAQILLFFVIPVKLKWVGYFNWAVIFFNAIRNIINLDVSGLLFTLVPIVNYLLFFGIKNTYHKYKNKSNSVISMKDYKKKMKVNKYKYIHKCEVCGVTNVDAPNMEFRYCSKCSGKHCYCEKHILEHEHK